MRRLVLMALSAALALAMIAPATASAQPTGDLLTGIPVTGTASDGSTFTGTATITEISRSGSQLLFDVVVRDATGAIVGTAEDVVGTLQEPDPGVCDILFLDLGPLFLDVLGLTVDLSPIELDINAVPGPGNLLGNLLCAVVGLLDGPGGGLGGAIDRLLDLINNLLGNLLG